MREDILRRLSEITAEEQAILDGKKTIDREIYMDGSTDMISGKKLLDKGKLIAIRPHTRFIAFPEHTHDYVEMVYMCSGETAHSINGTRIVLYEGELLMLGRNARQSIEPAGAADIAVNFIIRPEFFTGTLPYLGEEETPLRRFVVRCLTGEYDAGFLLFRVADVPTIQNLIENLLLMIPEEAPNRRSILQATMGLLFAHLLNHTETLTLSNGEQETVFSVLRYVEEHYKDGSLGELAAREHYELTALSRLIRARIGKTYTELVQEKRLSQAAWLLKNTDRRVDEIARSVGYENVSYFHRIFASRFDCSPKHYRDCK